MLELNIKSKAVVSENVLFFFFFLAISDPLSIIFTFLCPQRLYCINSIHGFLCPLAWSEEIEIRVFVFEFPLYRVAKNLLSPSTKSNSSGQKTFCTDSLFLQVKTLTLTLNGNMASSPAHKSKNYLNFVCSGLMHFLLWFQQHF